MFLYLKTEGRHDWAPTLAPARSRGRCRCRVRTLCRLEIAAHYGDAQREYDAVVRSAGALDVSYAGKLRVTGRDRVRYLHNMLSNDIKSLRPGQGCYATLLTHQGRMESDAYVYVTEQEIWLECSPTAVQRVEQTLNRFIVSDDVTVEDHTDVIALLSLQGPVSAALADRTAGTLVSGLDALQHCRVGPAPESWTVVRRDRTGGGGFDFWVASSAAAQLWHRWVVGDGIAPVGHDALNRLRTEAGIPWFGVDMDDRRLPMEMGLTSAISLSKGCYRGQEIVARVTHRGRLDRAFGAVAIGSGAVPDPGSEIRCGGKRAGEVTSAAHSPVLGSALALAVLSSEYLKPGTEVEVANGGSWLAGRVISLPLSRRA
jgi:folate-binding protein YgfZ